MLAPPWRVGAPSYRESWIRPCNEFLIKVKRDKLAVICKSCIFINSTCDKNLATFIVQTIKVY